MDFFGFFGFIWLLRIIPMLRNKCYFQVAENKATRELVKQKAHMITFIEQKRANNISIALSGIRMPYSQIKVSTHHFLYLTLDL